MGVGWAYGLSSAAGLAPPHPYHHRARVAANGTMRHAVPGAFALQDRRPPSAPRVFVPSWLLALAALAVSASKLGWVESSTRSVLGCAWCVTHSAVPHEAQWLMVLWALHLASRTALAAGLRLAALLRVVVVALLALAAADLFVLQQFLVRLTLGDAMKFAGEPQAVRGFLGQMEPLAAVLMATAVLTALLVAALYVRGGRGIVGFGAFGAVGRAGHRWSPWWLAAAVAGAVGSTAAKVDDQHTPYVQHSIEAFFASQSRHRAYSPAFASRVAATDRAAQRCFAGVGARPDVMLLMVESLSAYHSQLFSGLQDWTPELDRLSATATRLQNFHANGVNSEQGLIALLTGEPPIERPGAPGRTLFETFMTPADTLPRLLAREGYSSRFISGFNLDFPGLHPWLKAIGFDRIEGNEAAFFAGRSSQRLHFDSVPDELLFERLLHELALPRTAPLFVTSFTQSTHHPYIDPSSGARTQEAAFR